MPIFKNPIALIVATLFVSFAVTANAQTGTTGFEPRQSSNKTAEKDFGNRKFGSVVVKNNQLQLEQQQIAERRRQQETDRLNFLRDQQLLNDRILRRQALTQRAFGERSGNRQAPTLGSFRSDGFFAAKPTPGNSQAQPPGSNRPTILPAPRSVTIRNNYSSSSFEPTGYTGDDVSAPEPTKVTNPFFSVLDSETEK